MYTQDQKQGDMLMLLVFALILAAAYFLIFFTPEILDWFGL